MGTTVHNLRNEPMNQDDVYIGRAGRGMDGTFGNPYASGDRDRDIAMYREYLLKRLKEDPEFRTRVANLSGKRLFCFCKPQACHGDTLAKAADWLNSKRR